MGKYMICFRQIKYTNNNNSIFENRLGESKMTCVRRLFFGLLSALILGGMSFDAIAAAPNGDKANVESVELFQGIKDGKIDAKIVFKNRKNAVVSVENKTKQPLNVVMPAVAGAVPVLAQMGSDEGGLQGMMEDMDGGGGGGGMFRVAPEKVVRRDVEAICLDHGKKVPTPFTEYKIKPIEEVTDRPAVIELGKMMGKTKVDHETIQMAAWMLNNDLTTSDLAKETWTSANGAKSPVYSQAKLQKAASLAQFAMQKAQSEQTFIEPYVPTPKSESEN